MAVDKQTKGALNTLLADNTAAGISPEDVRQIVETMQHPMIWWWQDSGDSTPRTFAAMDTWYDLLSASTDTTKYSHDIADVGDDPVFLYNATPQRMCRVTMLATVTCASSDKDYSLSIAIDDVVQDGTITTFNYGTANKKQQVIVRGVIAVSNGEEIEIKVRADGHTTTLTFDRVSVEIDSPPFKADEV